MKILVLGKAGHGKDTFAEMYAGYHGLTFMSSSDFAFERAVKPVVGNDLDDMKKHDEKVWRMVMWALLKAYNTPDRARLIRELLAEYDIYCGLRDDDEYQAGKHHFDKIFWIDAGKIIGKPDPSMRIKFNTDEMIWVDNNRTLDDVREQVKCL